jgi:hypothetical protein
MTVPVEELEKYLRSLSQHYSQWWEPYAFMDEINEQTWFEFELNGKTQEKSTEPDREHWQIQPVLKAIDDYADQKIREHPNCAFFI